MDKILFIKITFVVGQFLLLYHFFPILSFPSLFCFFLLIGINFAIGYKWKDFCSITSLAIWFTLISIFLYQNNIENSNSSLLLKYLFSSQSALMWMAILLWGTTISYFTAVFFKNSFMHMLIKSLSRLCIAFGLSGMLTRWYESYLIFSYDGHFPLSNEFEVAIWLVLASSLLFIFFDDRYSLGQVGGILFLILSGLTSEIFWYDSQDWELQPLVPALQSVWIRIHVPASFIGYGCFAFAAAVGGCILMRKWKKLVWQLPSETVLQIVLYRSVLIGSLFFSFGIISGSLWAADAWGSYWQWDPKEVWALVVWLFYVTWLHFYITCPDRLSTLSVLVIIGFVISLMAFRGVNLWTSSLHSYG